YAGTELVSLTVRGGTGGNLFYVRSTPGAGSSERAPTVFLFSGMGVDTVNVGDYNTTLDGIQGPLVVTGQGAQDTLTIHDDGSHAAHTYTLTSTPTTSTLHRGGAAPMIAPITFDGSTETILIKGSGNVDTYTVQSPNSTFP